MEKSAWMISILASGKLDFKNLKALEFLTVISYLPVLNNALARATILVAWP